MSVCAISATKFYDEVAKNRLVYTIKDDKGYPCPENSEKKRVMPFWSSRSRVERIIARIPTYKNFKIEEMTFDEYKNWCVSLKNDGFLVGVNWSGNTATGYDLEPELVLKAIDFRINKKI